MLDAQPFTSLLQPERPSVPLRSGLSVTQEAIRRTITAGIMLAEADSGCTARGLSSRMPRDRDYGGRPDTVSKRIWRDMGRLRQAGVEVTFSGGAYRLDREVHAQPMAFSTLDRMLVAEAALDLIGDRRCTMDISTVVERLVGCGADLLDLLLSLPGRPLRRSTAGDLHGVAVLLLGALCAAGEDGLDWEGAREVSRARTVRDVKLVAGALDAVVVPGRLPLEELGILAGADRVTAYLEEVPLRPRRLTEAEAAPLLERVGAGQGHAAARGRLVQTLRQRVVVRPPLQLTFRDLEALGV